MTPPIAEELVQIDLVPHRAERKPEWLKARAPGGETFHNLKKLARDLDLHENVLRKWIAALRADPQQAFPGQGQMKPEQAEIERLRREVIRLKAERDILKKAAAYFAKESI